MTIARVCLIGVCALVGARCGAPSADDAEGAMWQVVRAPGTTSCAAVVLEYPGDFDHREQIGRYRSQAEAEAALERFRSTDDPMTVPGRKICQ
jgi:hypothetical protein